MKTYRELLQTDTYWITRIQTDLFNAVEDYLKSNNMTRTQFARELGVSKGYVSQVLGGDFNHRLSKLVELALAVGKAPVLEFEDLEEVAEKESRGMVRAGARYVPRAPLSIIVKHGKMEKEELSKTGKAYLLPNASLGQRQGKWEMKRPVIYHSLTHRKFDQETA